MVCNKTGKPEGLGRAVSNDDREGWLIEGLFKQGKKQGKIRNSDDMGSYRLSVENDFDYFE